MVLESLMNPLSARQHPWEMFFVGFFYSTIAMFLSLWIFRDQSSLIMVFLTVLACVPFMYHMIKNQEDIKSNKEYVLLKEHSHALSSLMYLFLGFVISFSMWYVFLPTSLTNILFSIQTETIRAINAHISGALVGGGIITGNLTAGDVFWKIFANNVKVLLFCIFFSFFYGAGAIFILTWNSTVISAAIGNFIRTRLSEVFGLAYFSIFAMGLMRYMTHGIFEILAYFMGGLAGGIVSVAVINHDINTKKFKKILLDSLDLTLLAILVLIAAAAVEVYITPIIFY